MRVPLLLKETLTHARANRVWAVAFLAALLMPFMLVFARAGIEICGGIIGLGFLWHSARHRQWRWLRDPFSLVCIVAWLWLSLVVAPFAVSPSAKMIDAVLWFRFPLMFAALRYWVLALPAPRMVLAYTIIVLLMLVVVDTWWQMLTGTSLSGNARIYTGRLTGPFANPKVGLYIAKMAMPVLALWIAAAVAMRSRSAIIIGAALLVLMVVTVLLTGERSPFITLMLASGVAAALMMVREKRWRIPCFLAAVATLVALAGLYLTNDWVRLRSNQGMETIRNYAQSDYGVLAKAGIAMGVDHWQHGVGVRGFSDLCPELPYNGYLFRGIHPHNMFVEWFAEAGAVGLCLFVAMIAILLQQMLQQFRAAQGMACLLPAVAIGVLVQHFFPLMGMQSFFTNWPAMMTWFPLALMVAAVPRVRHD